MLEIPIENIMSDHPIKIKENIRIGSVAHLLLRHQISGILVVKKDNENKLVGILTTTDLLRLVNQALSQKKQKINALKKISGLKAGDVASKRVISLQKDDKVMKAIAIMHRKNVHTIPIFDGQKVIGVIGKHDVLNVALL